jgi:aryl-alcohol dehydrogenase-like predicted oxidoreductase
MSALGRLCFGTAKVGMPWYGAGSVSRPGQAERAALVAQACTSGIRMIDTASAYGDAEDWVAIHAQPGVKVISKLAPAVAARALKYPPGSVAVLLLHNPSLHDLADKTFIAEWKDVCETIGAVPGASVYTADEVRATVDAGLSAVQAPHCWLDQRCQAALHEATIEGVATFARQPFLQGLLLNSGRDDSAQERYARQFRRALLEAEAVYGIAPLASCLYHALDTSGAEYVVFGAGSLLHLRDVVEVGRGNRPGTWRDCEAFLEARAVALPTVVMESLWGRK